MTSIRWWRVVLDEAQMVENKNNRPSKMVKLLPAVHRWATTGTPVEKDSIRCLYGLLYFLGFEPFTDEKLFDWLWNEYRYGRHDEMINILSKVMWRTCKKNVEHEINIPKQTEIIHRLQMSDLQKYFYNQAHLKVFPQFKKNVHDYLLRNGDIVTVEQLVGTEVKLVRERRIDPTMKDKFLYQLNNATLNIFLEPLRRLRQDCTIPSIMQNSTNDQARVKQTLRPEELHEHLVSKTSIETKSALRTIVSSINGIAALKIAEEKYFEALEWYKKVLKYATDYTGIVSVDSMLLIHVYHSLIEIATITENEDELKMTDQYSSKMRTLEWKYITKFYDKVVEINHEMDDLHPDLVKATRELTDKDGHWWLDIIHSARTGSQEFFKLLEVINLEVFSSVVNSSQIQEQLRTTHGIQLVIAEWCDKIQKNSKDVKKRFSSLEFIVKNLRPANEMSADENEKISLLTKVAQNCHLNITEGDEDEPSVQNSKKKGYCELCKLKMKLNEYECVLFNKSLVDDIVQGSWNPRLEEKLLKSVLLFAQRSDFDDEYIEMGNAFFKYLEAMKAQFKIYTRLWVEVNYTISAFDELNMCKMRIQVVENEDEINDEDARFGVKIMRYEIDGQIQVFTEQKRDAEITFVRLNGRLKYLQHLKDRDELQTCPICGNLPKERYFVTICGHTLCAECFHQLVKYRNRSVNCPVCRTTQETANIYAVTCSDSLSSNPITGSYSPKIDEIIRCVLKLKREDPDVKILIFSHWDQILHAIINGFATNGITYRTSLGSSFVKHIQEFKDFSREPHITCMMLNLKFGGKGLNLVEGTCIHISLKSFLTVLIFLSYSRLLGGTDTERKLHFNYNKSRFLIF